MNDNPFSPGRLSPLSGIPPAGPPAGFRRSWKIWFLMVILILLIGAGTVYALVSAGKMTLPWKSSLGKRAPAVVIDRMVAGLDEVRNPSMKIHLSLKVEQRQSGTSSFLVPENSNTASNILLPTIIGALFLPTGGSVEGWRKLAPAESDIALYVDTDTPLITGNGELTMKGYTTVDGQRHEQDIAAKKIGEAMYYLDNNSEQKKWVASELYPDDDNILYGLIGSFDPPGLMKQAQGLIHSARDAELFSLNAASSGSELVAGTTSEKYVVSMDPEKWPAVLDDYKRALETNGTVNNSENKSQIEYISRLQQPEQLQLAQGIIKNSTVSLWLNPQNDHLAQIEWQIRIIPLDTSEELTGQQLTVTLRLSGQISQEPRSITAPADTISEQAAEFQSLPVDEQQYESQIHRLINVQNALNRIKKITGAYPADLAQLATASADARAQCRREWDELSALPQTDPARREHDGRCGSSDFDLLSEFNVNDMYSGQPLQITYTDDGRYEIPYTLHYHKSLTDYWKRIYVDGINTATPETLSLEGRKQDRDADGLADTDEYGFGTDYTKADTDGDGFTDGSEVQNGYNPNGSGTHPVTGEWTDCLERYSIDTCSSLCSVGGRKQYCSNFGTASSTKNIAGQGWKTLSACQSGAAPEVTTSCGEPIKEWAGAVRCYCEPEPMPRLNGI